jgi:hypothetical protein
MTQLEDRLRSAFQAKAADIPDTAPPLDLAPLPRRSGSVISGGRRNGGGGPRRWLTPLAAAAAVAVVIALALVMNVIQGTPPAAPIQRSVPPYYVAVAEPKPGQPIGGNPAVKTTVTVRATATGAVLAKVKVPRPYAGFEAISGAADDRTFVLLAQGSQNPSTLAFQARFYRLRINPHAASAAGRVTLTALPITIGQWIVHAFALSPDGNSLAAIMANGLRDYLYAWNLDTGARRIWIRKVCHHGTCEQTALGSADWTGFTNVQLSWAATGRSLAFISGGGVSQLRLLNLANPGDDVTSNSTPFRTPRTASSTWYTAYMAPDAKSVIIEFSTMRGMTSRHNLVRFSAATGKLTPINSFIYSTANGTNGYLRDDVLWVNYSGNELIVSGVRSAQSAGIYRGTHYTPLKWPANVISAAW